jgi:hypothetical protein
MYDNIMMIEQFYSLLLALELREVKYKNDPWMIYGGVNTTFGVAWPTEHKGLVRVCLVKEKILEYFVPRMPQGWKDMLPSFLWSTLTDDGELGPCSLIQFVIREMKYESKQYF